MNNNTRSSYSLKFGVRLMSIFLQPFDTDNIMMVGFRHSPIKPLKFDFGNLRWGNKSNYSKFDIGRQQINLV